MEPDGNKRFRRRRRVLIVGTGGMSNASARARVFCYLPYLAEFGIRAHVTGYVYHKHLAKGGGLWSKLWLELLGLRNAIAFLFTHVVYIHRMNFMPWIVTVTRLLGKRIVHDFDDAVFLNPPDSEEYHEKGEDRERAKKLDWILRRADLVLVSTRYLYDYASARAREVRLLPSVVAEVADQPSGWHEPLVIGWVGAPENQRYLRNLEPVLMRIQRDVPAAEVWIVTRELMDPPPQYRHKFWPWSLEAEANLIPRFTVGIAPLADDPWCRAKMNYKALVYISHGVPAVISTGGFPIDEFEDGRSVMVARSEEDWYRHIKDLISDPARRNDVAAAGLNVVRERFTANARIEQFVEALTTDDG